MPVPSVDEPWSGRAARGIRSNTPGGRVRITVEKLRTGELDAGAHSASTPSLPDDWQRHREQLGGVEKSCVAGTPLDDDIVAWFRRGAFVSPADAGVLRNVFDALKAKQGRNGGTRDVWLMNGILTSRDRRQRFSSMLNVPRLMAAAMHSGRAVRRTRAARRIIRSNRARFGGVRTLRYSERNARFRVAWRSSTSTPPSVHAARLVRRRLPVLPVADERGDVRAPCTWSLSQAGAGAGVIGLLTRARCDSFSS